MSDGVGEHVPAADEAAGHAVAVAHARPTTPFLASPPQKFIFSLAAATAWDGVAPATPNGRVSARTAKAGSLQAPGRRGGGPRPPSPASHHVGVSGGGWTTALTPHWWERGAGGGRDA